MKSFLVALQYLTIFPVRPYVRITNAELVESFVFFPVVGALLGAASAIVYIVLERPFGQMVASAVLIPAYMILTGGLQLNGFVRISETVRNLSHHGDEESGTDYPASAIITSCAVILLLLRFSLLSTINSSDIIGVLIVMATSGRWAMVIGGKVYPLSDRQITDESSIVGFVGQKEMFWSTITTLIILVALVHLRAVLLIPLILVVALVLSHAVVKKNGHSRDNLGILNEIVELLVLFALVGFLR
jgi:adenosylcobinamide-GDP ribazoletransferase